MLVSQCHFRKIMYSIIAGRSFLLLVFFLIYIVAVRSEYLWKTS